MSRKKRILLVLSGAVLATAAVVTATQGPREADAAAPKAAYTFLGAHDLGTVQTVPTGTGKRTLVGTVTLPAGTYQTTLNATIVPNTNATDSPEYPEITVIQQHSNPSFETNLQDIGGVGLAPGLLGTDVTTYESGTTFMTLSGTTTLTFYAGGVDGDRQVGSYTIDDLTFYVASA